MRGGVPSANMTRKKSTVDPWRHLSSISIPRDHKRLWGNDGSDLIRTESEPPNLQLLGAKTTVKMKDWREILFSDVIHTASTVSDIHSQLFYKLGVLSSLTSPARVCVHVCGCVGVCVRACVCVHQCEVLQIWAPSAVTGWPSCQSKPLGKGQQNVSPAPSPPSCFGIQRTHIQTHTPTPVRICCDNDVSNICGLTFRPVKLCCPCATCTRTCTDQTAVSLGWGFNYMNFWVFLLQHVYQQIKLFFLSLKKTSSGTSCWSS